MGSVILKKRRAKIICIVYIFALATYLFVGFQPSPSSAAENFIEESEVSSPSTASFLIINSIGLKTPTKAIALKNHTLAVPDEIAGSFSENDNKTLLFGHSSTVFKNLKSVKIGDIADYNDHSYRVVNITTRKKDDISMKKILKAEEKNTIVLMTCTGESLGNNDYSHRLIITAEAVDKS